MHLSPNLKNIGLFYYEGFKNLTLGRTLWKMIILKVVIIFGVFKLFFFSNTLDSRFDSETQKASHVLENLTKGHR